MAVRIRAGELRSRVTIERATLTQNSFGEQVQTWAAIGERIAANVEPLDGSEPFGPTLAMGQQAYRLMFRYGSAWGDLTSKDRIVYGDLTLDLASVVNMESRNKAFSCIGVVRG